VLLQLWYSNKDNLVSGEATVNVAKNQKANVTFNQAGSLLQTAKYTYINVSPHWCCQLMPDCIADLLSTHGVRTEVASAYALPPRQYQQAWHV
jgi:hypothetical protein